MIAIQYIETEETIRLKVHHAGKSYGPFYLDADDTRWELAIDETTDYVHLLTSTNGDFEGANSD